MPDPAGARYPDLEGRHVFVSGGATGIGAALVRAFAAQASRVSFIDIADDAGRALAEALSREGGRVRFEHNDVRDVPALQAAIARAASAFGAVGVLVNNAARDDRHALEEVTPAYWDDNLATNLRHHFFAAQAVAPGMAATGKGAIVNLGSVSWMRGRPNLAAYTTSKAAILGLTRTLARELGPRGIRVNCLVPGAVDTARQRALWTTPDKVEAVLAEQCLRLRVGEDDVAQAALFLASDVSRAITGIQLVVDAGLAQTSVIA